MDYTEQPEAKSTATAYAQDVVAGKIIAGNYVRLACKRFLYDLETCEQRGFFFDDEAAQHAVDFFGFLNHVKGEFAKSAATSGFVLSNWQVFIVANLFGWRLLSNGARRFREAHLELARKNGKSTFIAGIGLYMLFADGEPGSEVYSAACTKEQARIVFTAAKDMVKKSPSLSSRIGIWRNNLHVDETNSKFEPLASDSSTLDGLNIHCGLIDELHEHPDRALYDVLNTATGSRLQALIVAITTAGFNREGICWTQRTFGVKLLTGKIPDDDFATRVANPRFFAFIATLDNDDDIWDERNWPKANPNLNISVNIDTIRALAAKAKEDPSSLNEFCRKHLNVWTSNETAWLPDGVWEKNCAAGPLANPKQLREEALKKLKGRRCFGGLDLSGTDDITAFALVFPPCEEVVTEEQEEDPTQVYVMVASTGKKTALPRANAEQLVKLNAGRILPEAVKVGVKQKRQERDDKWSILIWFFIPKDFIAERVKKGRVPYDVWVREGYITATDGNSINQEIIRNTVLQEVEPYRLGEVGYDKWGAEWIGPKLESDGLKMTAIPQRFEFLSPPTKQLTGFVKANSIEHFNNPVLRWMASNVQLLLDSNGNQRPDKGKSREKIDGILAVVMALGRALANPIAKNADSPDRFKVHFV